MSPNHSQPKRFPVNRIDKEKNKLILVRRRVQSWCCQTDIRGCEILRFSIFFLYNDQKNKNLR